MPSWSPRPEQPTGSLGSGFGAEAIRIGSKKLIFTFSLYIASEDALLCLYRYKTCTAEANPDLTLGQMSSPPPPNPS